MTAAAFSADGSVLAVAAETVITLWDPDNNALVAVIGEAQMVNFSDPNCLWIILFQKHILFCVNHFISA